MKQSKWLIFLMLLVGVGVRAQTVSSVTIGLTLPGPVFIVDGQQYNTSQVFLWPQGSKHIVQFLYSVDETTGNPFPYQASNGDDTRWSFGGWTDNLGLLTAGGPIQTVTATPSLTSIIGHVTLTYRLTIQFYNSPAAVNPNPNCGGAPDPAPTDALRYGIVYVDGACYGDTVDIFVTPGVHNFEAFPYPGYGFAGWIINGLPPDPYLFQYTVTAPIRIIPSFQPAKRVKFRTNPAGLKVLIDHSLVTTPPPDGPNLVPGTNISSVCQPNYTLLPPTPPPGVTPLCIGDFDFIPGSKHQVGAPTPQMDNAGKYWVFSAFSDGLKQNDTYVTDTRLDLVDTVTANFIPGVTVSIVTNPLGVNIAIDGRSNWPAKNFVWGAGETHHLAAPPTFTDAHGRVWQFVDWSNKGPAEQDITVPTDATGFAITANYQLLGQVQVTSTPPGLSFMVDGASCTTPCVLNQTSGTQTKVTIPNSIAASNSIRYDFDNWSGGTNATTLTATFNTGVQTFTANYHTSYLLATSSDPAGGATFKLTPPSPDGYFPAGTQVTVTAVPSDGYKFRRWGGDLSTSFSTGYLTMNGPHSVVAQLDTVPFIPPAGIQSAAGPTPDGTVAPGSIISIYGQNLAGGLDVGPSNPLAQTLGNVTVTVNGQLLPLMFVSPQQINAQLPSNLADGSYPLTVHLVGQADVSGKVNVSRDAPALFTQQNQQQLPLVAALHQDNTLITPDSPARRGEVISIYGTGFGPYDHPTVDGFPVPMPPPLYVTADPVAVQIAGATLPAVWAGAAPGMTGIAIVQLKIDDPIPAGTTVDLVVTVNGKPSNTVKLPVE
jgi:uncharacterized protein (TIGR03437 family)